MSRDLTDLPTETVEICANCNLSFSERDIRFEDWLCLISSYQVRNCISCGLRWLSPRPTSIGYERVYSADNYFTAQAGEDVAYENLLDGRTAHFEKRLSTLRSYFLDKNVLNILDYGAATGEFVAAAKKFGHNCFGIEFSSDARQIALEKNHIKLFAPDGMSDNGLLFDVMHMNHVLEHMPNPAEHLSWCRKKLANDGLLIIEIPQQFHNHIDRLKRLLKRGGKFNKFTAFSLHHTYFFKVQNIIELIENSGFKVEHITTDVIGARYGSKKSINTLIVRCISWVSDRFFSGGDNIEIYARAQKNKY
jgi:2-polyprenyl-3-methyl-5-hydroxy-6-metoxy-1,4-benzoquinol methylase